MSIFGGASPSLADIAAVTRGNNDNDGFGGNNGWWILIILFAIFGGWGNNGGCGCNNGNGGGGATVVYDTGASMQRGFDTQGIISKLDGINSGICSLGYDQLAQMNGINANVTQTGYNIIQAVNQDTIANMQNTNALSRQLDNCCCENRAALADIKYTMATDTCALKNEIHQTGDAIIQNQNAGFNMLNQTVRDGFRNLEMQQKDQYIAQLERKLNECDRDSALQSQATYLLNRLDPRPIPSYDVPNPNCCYNNGRSWGNGCCNNNTCCA